VKNVYIHCPLLSPEDYRTVLERLCPDPVRNVTVYTYADRACPKTLAALVEVQKNFGLERSLRFRNVVVFSQVPRFGKSLRRVLTKNNISVDLQVKPEQAPHLLKIVKGLEKSGISNKLWVDETADQQEAYRCFSAQGLYLHMQRPQYDEHTADWFSQWLYDPKAQGINTFGDIITMLTLDTYSPNCRHASCFGTTFRVDDRLQVYLCPHHMDGRTCLGKLQDRDVLLQCDRVAQLLTTAIQKREKCTAQCKGFAFCQGGCLLEADTAEECIHYFATVERIRTSLLEVYRSGDLSRVNNVVKNAILNALAFGTAFFK